MASLSLKISLTLGSSVLAGTIALSLLAHRPSQHPTPSSPARAQGQASPRDPAKIFAASCATCHGANGLGEQPSWTSPSYIAPTIARGFPARVPWYEEFYTYTIRNGHYAGDGFRPAMPAFGKEVISDQELVLLVNWLLYQPPLGGSIPGVGVPPPPRPKGREILLEILDEAPWFHDDGTDTRDPANDRRRVYLSPNEYIKVVNRGKTWHTVTNKAIGFDTGFIGPSTNIPGQDVGYCYITLDDLPPGANRYICILHPYMQVEIITPSHDGEPLTHATKLPLSPPPTPGIGEVWVGLQSWKNEQGPDGAVAVIHAEDWTYRLIPNVGNNPHNGWMGTALTPEQRLQKVAVFTSWHDSRAVVVDAETYQVLGSFPVGAAPAHVMTAPARRGKNEPDRWFVTIMGSNKVQEIEPILDLSRAEPDRPEIGQGEAHRGRPGFAPHGIWFLDHPEYFLTANTLAHSVSLYGTEIPWQDPRNNTGIGAEINQLPTGGKSPLAVSVMNTNDPRALVYKAFCNNAGTDDVSLFRVLMNASPPRLQRISAPKTLRNSQGNIPLKNLNLRPVRWAHMPIQAIVSPPDSTEHGRYLVVCNKASFNVSIIPLDPQGNPTGVYTFPAGLGAHGVAFGRKAPDPKRPNSVSYYAYVSNTFENYVSVYDLELLEQMINLEKRGQAPPEFRPGGAKEWVRITGYGAQLISGQNEVLVPITLLSPDARGVVHVGDVLLPVPSRPAPKAFLKEHLWIDLPGFGMVELPLDVTTDTGGMGVFCNPLPPPWR